jgi:hypothetical protein
VDPTARLNGTLDGRYRIERQFGAGAPRLRLGREERLSVEEVARRIADIAALQVTYEHGVINREMQP